MVLYTRDAGYMQMGVQDEVYYMSLSCKQVSTCEVMVTMSIDYAIHGRDTQSDTYLI